MAAGREALITNAETMAEMTRAAVRALKLSLFAAEPCSALTAIRPPQGADSGDIVKLFRQQFGAVVANGQGEMKGKIFRIAHLGYLDYMDTMGIVGALDHVLASLARPGHIEFGLGLKAAQEVYARAVAEKQQVAVGP